ncbi:peptidase M28 [Novosphingobium sp. PC22D]|uniref:M28 family peptidase n=1 Tax=Novosphingobium sp. PC22D TaxID=1962403 RepID=UPI000BEF493B|nr:M28 family peptidase [Novosphingobium sp. PC22D]PEQ13243.1 peptidase M28 [Novosphingobium sp. PC22D]
MNRGTFAIRAALAALCCAATALVPGARAAPSRLESEIEQRLRAHIDMLASDAFEGREPGTEGEAKTLRYLGREWFDIGLVSGTNDPGHEWFAPVTLVAREPASSTAQFRRARRPVYVDPEGVLMLTSGKRSLVRDAPLLFVGKAQDVDFTRAELAGRVAVLLDGDVEGGARQNALLGQGASAVLTVLDGERTLEEVAARRRRSGYALADDSLGGDLEGFVTREAMVALLKGSKHSLDGLERLAAEPGFTPLALDITASLEATTSETTIRTHNLIGKIPGRRSGAGAVLFVAHWDHFGNCGEETAEDRICNGAIDNASGVAALTEIARLLVRGKEPDRDIYFLATTAEELGLLGAHAFAENPPLPLDQIVAAFNIDSVAIAPAGTPVAIVGRGMTALDPLVEKVARREHIKVVPGDEANEYVKRQDGWAMLKHDIPTVMVTTAYGEIALMRAFFDGDYHRPSDDLSHPLELGGAVRDVRLGVALGRWFADVERVPGPVPPEGKAPPSPQGN